MRKTTLFTLKQQIRRMKSQAKKILFVLKMYEINGIKQERQEGEKISD
jgi:hypothetical protein